MFYIRVGLVNLIKSNKKKNIKKIVSSCMGWCSKLPLGYVGQSTGTGI